MKLLINLCAQDGIISHNSGVGTMAKRYIELLRYLFQTNDIEYEMNLFTPEYIVGGYGYSQSTKEENIKFDNVTIYELSNGSNGEHLFGIKSNWEIISTNISEIINKQNHKEYDYVLTLLNDTPFAKVLELTQSSDNHYKVWIPHSTAKIHNTKEELENDIDVIERVEWELEAINYINKTDNTYVGVIGDFITKHLIKEYGLNKNKIKKLYNGEILYKDTEYAYDEENKKIFNNMSKDGPILLSFGRPVSYKNLDGAIELGKELNIRTIVVTQQYYPGMPYVKYLKEIAGPKTELYIDKPFSFPQYIIQNYPNDIILLVPSYKEIAGLVINEIRKFNKDNILLVANNIDGLKEQINDGVDGILVNMENIKSSAKKIKKNFNKNTIKKININSQNRVKRDYDLEENLRIFIANILNIELNKRR